MQDGVIESDPAESTADGQVTAEELTTSANVTDGIEKIRDIGADLIDALPVIGIGLGILLVFFLIGQFIKWIIRRHTERRKKPRGFALAVGSLASGLAIVLGLLVAAVIIFPNFTPTRMLSFLGLGSVAIGFAFRDVLQNYLAGILILFTEPFRIGDQIVFKEYEGTVIDIQTRATLVRTYDGRRAVIPNAELFTNSVLVNTAFERRRIEYDVGIGYGDDIDLAKRIMMEVMAADKSAIDDPAPEVLVYELAGDHVTLRARWWIDPPQRREALDSRDAVLAQMKVRLTEAGIDLPFPTQQVLFHDQTEDRDGDRRTQREGWPARKDDPADTRRRRKPASETEAD